MQGWAPGIADLEQYLLSSMLSSCRIRIGSWQLLLVILVFVSL
jgi:hypothetical protein